MMENKDHISLVLPLIGNVDGNNSIPSISSSSRRKSCRRYWNQLPRCQKNLIISAIIVICITILIFLSGDNIVINEKLKDYGHIQISAFKDERQNTHDSDKFPPKLQQQPKQKLLVGKSDNVIVDSQSLNQVVEPISLNNNNNNVNGNNNDQLDNNLKENLNRIEPAIDDCTPQQFDGPKNTRQLAVVDAFKHSWKGYKEYAWGHDNLKPISMSSHDWFGLGLTIVDSLDTMYIMNLIEEFDEARNWVDNYLNFDINRDVNLFEVTIRVLGGLLSAYHLSGDKMFLKKSLDLGNRLLPSFNSPSGIPYSDINLASMRAHSPKWSPDSSTSEVTTIQLEFRDLSYSTGIPDFENMIQRVNEKIHELEKTNGLVPIFINANTGTFRNFATISLGARGDSYYEYLLKQWIQTGRKPDDILLQDYKQSIDGVLANLVKKTPKEHLTYVGELISGKDFKPKMDHLTCYLPGTLLLGYKYGKMPESHLNLAIELLETCYKTYTKQPTGLAPEITYFNNKESFDDANADNTNGNSKNTNNGNESNNNNDDNDDDIQVKSNDAHNLLRPEFIESLYYFYVLTHNRTYQDWGWNIFQSFEKYTKVKSGGYTSIGNVRNIYNTRPRDMMESFWLGETLKYFYLLFSDNYNEIDLDKYVFNTEAHPLPIRKN